MKDSIEVLLLEDYTISLCVLHCPDGCRLAREQWRCMYVNILLHSESIHNPVEEIATENFI
jgi:hypothetical protein